MNQDNLITAGEFAKLSQSTKRTIIWYTENRLLRPVRINPKGYRFYKPEQIIDFQVILLLRRLNFSIEDIKKALRKNASLENFFEIKQQELKKDIDLLQLNLMKVRKYYSNLEKYGVLIEPVIKQLKPFDIYFIERIGPYSKIYDFGLELRSYFAKIPKNATYLTLFKSQAYLPKRDFLQIAVVFDPKMKLKRSSEAIVKRMTIPGFKSLSYIHAGSPALISMLWNQLDSYQQKNKFKRDHSLPFSVLEFYIKTSLNDFHDEERMISELNMPII